MSHAALMVTVVHRIIVHVIILSIGVDCIAKYLSVLYPVYMVTVPLHKCVPVMIQRNGMVLTVKYLFVMYHVA
jgi:hypothetical protein